MIPASDKAPRRQCPWGQVVALVLVAALAGLGVYWYRLAGVIRRHIDQAIQAATVEIAADLSQPGEVRGVLRPSHIGAHGQCILLRVQPPFESDDQAARALAGLRFRMEIQGEEPYEDGPGTRPFGDEPQSYLLSYPLGAQPADDRPFTLKVLEPAPGLAGRKQMIVSRPHLCGLEYLPAAIPKLGAIVCVVAAAVIVLAMLSKWFGRRRGQSVPDSGTSSGP